MIKNAYFQSQISLPTSEGKETEIEDIADVESEGDGQEGLTAATQLRRSLLLGVAYSANIGGTGVITGTSPNLVVMAVLSE